MHHRRKVARTSHSSLSTCSPVHPKLIIGEMTEDKLIPKDLAYAAHHIENYFYSLIVASGQTCMTNHKSRTAKLIVQLVLLCCFPSACLCVNKQHMLMNIWLRWVRLEGGRILQQSKMLPTLELAEPWEDKNPKFFFIYQQVQDFLFPFI